MTRAIIKSGSLTPLKRVNEVIGVEMWRNQSGATSASSSKSLSQSQYQEVMLKYAKDVTTLLTNISASSNFMDTALVNRNLADIADCLGRQNETLDCLLEVVKTFNNSMVQAMWDTTGKLRRHQKDEKGGEKENPTS